MGHLEEANIGVIKEFYRYLAEGDRDGAYRNTFAEDCVLYESPVLPYGGVYHGRERMKDTLAGVVAGFDEFEVDLLNYLAGGDEVIVHLNMKGVGRETRKPFDVRIMELWRIKDGKAVELKPFLYDPVMVAEALKT